jgi:hypothetical protein
MATHPPRSEPNRRKTDNVNENQRENVATPPSGRTLQDALKDILWPWIAQNQRAPQAARCFCSGMRCLPKLVDLVASFARRLAAAVEVVRCCAVRSHRGERGEGAEREASMSMDKARVDLVLQFALLEAGRQDDPFERELGPIHLIKYVYLADLTYASAHGGHTFTGARWRFFHYGPWAPEVHNRIKPALQEIDANEKNIPSKYDDDFIRWTKADDQLHDQVERQLPTEVVSVLRRSVKKYGKQTSDLLHHVYSTTPMLRAAPNEDLVFEGNQPATEPAAASVEISVKQQKRADARFNEAKSRVAEKLAKKREQRVATQAAPAPRYDDVFYEGVEWLDSLAGKPVPTISASAVFSEEVWDSPNRSERRG